MKIFLDTNILIDWAEVREPFFENADNIFCLCNNKNVDGVVSTLSIANLFYILRKKFNSNERENIYNFINGVFEITELDNTLLQKAVKDRKFKDFEDRLQLECALKKDCDYIITRNIKDFEKSEIKALTPDEFLNMIGKDEKTDHRSPDTEK